MKMHSLLLVLLIGASSAIHANIVKISKLKEILEHVKSETLVIFDLDNTLIRPQEGFDHQSKLVKGLLGSDQWVDHMCKKVDFPKFRELYRVIQHHTDMQLVEGDGTIEVIKELQKNNIHFMGLTARCAPLAERTHEQINKLGLSFDANAPHKEDIHFDGGRVKYVRGITFCSGSCKALALELVLKHTQLNPEHIMMVDDKAKYPITIGEHIKSYPIKFTGFHYAHLEDFVKNFDAEVADAELQEFLQRVPEAREHLPALS